MVKQLSTALRTISCLLMLALGFQANATLMSFEFEFQLDGSTYLTGSFIADDVNDDDMIIDDELISLSFTNGIQSTINHTFDAALSDNFNFDVISSLFLFGGNSFGDLGQRWNSSGTGAIGFGFEAGSACAGLDFDGAFLGCDATPATRIVQIINEVPIDDSVTVPEPSTLAIFGLSLLAFGASRRKQQ